MEVDRGDTAVLPRKTRGERRVELQELADSSGGVEWVARLYRLHFRLSEARPAPPTHIMIARIISKEYPDG